MADSTKIGDYVDAVTGMVTNPLENPFGDSVWLFMVVSLSSYFQFKIPDEAQ